MVNNDLELHVALLQSNPKWEDIPANLATLEEDIRKIEEPIDLLILPEMFSTGFTMAAEKLAEVHNGHTYRWMQLMAKHLNAWIIGTFIVKENQQFFNRLYAVSPSKECIYYDKKYLYSPAEESKTYTSGSSKSIFTIKGWKILPLVCYDLRFPEWSRSFPKEGHPYAYDVLVYCASWPSPRILAWDTLLSARAIENQSYCLGVNRVGEDANGHTYPGHSAAYDYSGVEIEKIIEIKAIRTIVLNKEKLMAFRDKLPFWKDTYRGQ